MKAPRYANPLSPGDLRNKLCPCLSGKKAKKCHGQDPFVSKEKREEISAILNNYLVPGLKKALENESDATREFNE